MADEDKPIIDIDFGDIIESPIAPLDLSETQEKKKPAIPILLVIRHGNTFEKDEPPRRIGARTDLQLTKEGRIQAARLRIHFEKEGLIPQRIYSSPLQRTMQTAAQISPSYEILEFLREIYHGMDENKPEDEVIRRLGKAALEKWDKQNILPPGWTADILGIRQGWQGIKKLCRDAGGTWAAVTSGGIARFALDNVEGVPAEHKLSTGSYGKLVFDLERQVWKCEGWNIKP